MRIFIAGATGDIGKAISETLASEHDLLLSYRDEEKKKELNSILIGNRFSFVCIKNLLKEAEKIKNTIFSFKPNIFINAIGDGFYAKVEEVTLDMMDASYEANFKIPFFLTQMVYCFFLSQKKGHIIMINSLSGLEGFPYGAAYCSMKFALRGLTEVIYKEGKRYGIQVTTIYPGIVKTKLIKKMPFCPKEKCLLSPKTIAKLIKYILNLEPTAEIKEIILKNKELIWR